MVNNVMVIGSIRHPRMRRIILITTITCHGAIDAESTNVCKCLATLVLPTTYVKNEAATMINRIRPLTVAVSTSAFRKPSQRRRKKSMARSNTIKLPTPAVSVGVAIPK